jgi:F-type H+-transporting ATPase subunit delta
MLKLTEKNFIAKRYAKALFALAQKDDTIEVLEKNFVEFDKLMANSAELTQFLTLPFYKATDQEVVLAKISDKNKYHKIFKNFLLVLVKNNRISLVQNVFKAFSDVYDEFKGKKTVYVTSAFELNDKQIKEISKKFSANLNKEVEVSLSLDPSLIGGLVMRVDSMMYDNSVKTKLEDIAVKSKEAFAAA